MHQDSKLSPARRKSHLGILLVIILLLIVWAADIYLYLDRELSATKGAFADGRPLTVSDFVAAKNLQLAGESQGRTNVMIYGLTADGLRTDTMILASYYWQQHKLVLLNIPRDLYANDNGYNTKIVSLYTLAKNQRPNDPSFPPQYVSDFISREYGIPIHYWVVLNMQAFVQLIDSLGGLTVNVQRSFTDCLYPNADYTGYIRPCPHFSAGVQTMNGATALIYARSRHSTDPLEGTDFARSKRQQIIIKAALAKLKQQGALTDLSKLDTYLKIFGANVYTNLTPPELVKSAQLASGLRAGQDFIMANWSNQDNFLCDSADANGAYVLRYGTLGDCTGQAGVNDGSPYRQQAVNYVQNLLQSAAAASASGTPAAANQ